MSIRSRWRRPREWWRCLRSRVLSSCRAMSIIQGRRAARLVRIRSNETTRMNNSERRSHFRSIGFTATKQVTHEPLVFIAFILQR